MQSVISQGVETSGVERSSCDARVWVLPKRQNKMADIILDRQRDYPAKVSHYPVAFICCKQQRRNKLFFCHVRFLFFSIFPPRTNICIEYSSTSVTSVLTIRDLVRKWHHNSDDSTDIIFKIILSVLYFSLISSCAIHHLLWHLFFAAQFQDQMICFHY